MVDNSLKNAPELRYRCKICRQSLFWTSNLVTARGDSVVTGTDGGRGQGNHSANGTDNPLFPADIGTCPVSHWFLNDDNQPEWTQPIIDAQSWSSGKIHCPKCKQKLGAFDFVTSIPCTCGEHNIPPIRILKGKVDESSPSGSPIRRPNVIPRPSFIPERKQLPMINSSDVTTKLCNNACDEDKVKNEYTCTSHQDSVNSTIDGAGKSLLPTSSLPFVNGELLTDYSDIVDESVTLSRGVEDLPNTLPAETDHEYEDIITSLETTGNMYETLEHVEGGNLSETLDDDEGGPLVDPEHYSCAVCLEVYYQPHACEPCDHIFCGPCLRRLNGAARASPKCPLCRKTIVKCHPNKELLQMIKYYFPEDFQYRKRIENSQKKKLPHLPGTGSLSGFFRRRRGRGREGTQILAASAGVCFVVCLIFLGFAVFATTIGFVMWFLLEVAMDAIPEIYFATDNFFRYSFQALALWCLDGNIPEGHAGAINASLLQIVSSFSRLANRTMEFFNDGEVVEHLQSSYNYIDQFSSLIPADYGKLSYFTMLYYFLYSAVFCFIILLVYVIYRTIRYIFSL